MNGKIRQIPPRRFCQKDRFMVQMGGAGLRPFAAVGRSSDYDDSGYRQLGLRWQGGQEDFSMLAEGSVIDEENRLLGADLSALGASKAKTWQGRVALRTSSLSEWHGFAQYEMAHSQVEVSGNNFVRDISGLRANGWRLGLERSDFFMGRDTIRLWAGRDTALRSGNMRLRHLRAEGDFVDAFYGVQQQSLQWRETNIDLSNSGGTIFRLGYAMPLSDKARAAVGMEQRDKDTAMSAELRLNF